jgi:Flp pilus assembly protein TadG
MRFKKNKNEFGGVLAEASIGIGILFFVIFHFLYLGIYLYKKATIQYIIDETSRKIGIGKINRSTSDLTITNYDISESKDEIQRRASQFGISISPDMISVCSLEDIDCTAPLTSVSSGAYSIRFFQRTNFYGLPISVSSILSTE